MKKKNAFQTKFLFFGQKKKTTIKPSTRAPKCKKKMDCVKKQKRVTNNVTDNTIDQSMNTYQFH